MKKLDPDALAAVSGGQYDHDATYGKTVVIKDGNLYNVHNMLEVVGHISVGQKVLLHPEFSYAPQGVQGVVYCIVKIGGQDYVTERANIQ